MGDDVVIDLSPNQTGDQTILLLGVDIEDLDDNDFILDD